MQTGKPCTRCGRDDFARRLDYESTKNKTGAFWFVSCKYCAQWRTEPYVEPKKECTCND